MACESRILGDFWTERQVSGLTRGSKPAIVIELEGDSIRPILISVPTR